MSYFILKKKNAFSPLLKVSHAIAYILTFVIAIFLKILTNYVLCIWREIQKVEFMCTATSDTAPEILTAFSFIHAKKAEK